MPAIVRLADDRDAPGIAAVHVAAWKAAYRGLMPDHVLDSLNVNERTDQWQRRLQHADRPTFVADLDNLIHGFCNLHPRDNHEMEITAIYVIPDSWRTGYGRQLCQHSIRHAATQGCPSLFLWTLESNHPARSFYQRIGFTLTGERKTDRQLIGSDLVEVKYRRSTT